MIRNQAKPVFKRNTCLQLSRLFGGATLFVFGAMGVLHTDASDAAPPRSSTPRATISAPKPVVEAPVPEPVVEPPAAEPPPIGRTYSFTLKEMGAQYPLNLRGVDGRDSVLFTIRADEVVTGAELKMFYSYSPSMIPDLSHINVLMNDEVATTIELPKETAGTDLEKVVKIPPRLITENNSLSLQLIGHYTMQCEDPLHSSLWAKVSNNSILEITTTPLALLNDLAILPLPFLDKRDMREMSVPMVFINKPDANTTEAAGIVASWFGAIANYRPVRFPAVLDTIPAKGSAVVFVIGKSSSLNADIGQVTGPTLSMIPNPSDPNGKLLLVMGRDSKELRQAAAALAVGSDAMSGQTAVITNLTEITPRKPYDAPNWLPSTRPVTFGELASTKTMNVSGYAPAPIRINMRVPPDLFGWREKGVPVALNYRYTPQPSSTNSSVLININDKFVKSYPLFPIDKLGGGDSMLAKVMADDTMPMQAKFNIPLFMMYPQSQLQVRYMYDYIKQGECRDIIIDNVRGALDPDSTLDISGYSHFMPMPDLSAFTSSGFPFTRMADLSETAVVLSDTPNPQEYSTYLEVMGRMGASTGYPVTGVSVTQAAQVEGMADKDLLIVATGSNQPLLKQWAGSLPASLDGSRRFNISDLAHKVWNFISPNTVDRLQRARVDMAYKSVGEAGLFAGFESPLKSGRSAVLIWGASPDALTDNVSALIGGEDYESGIFGSLAVVRGKKVDALVADQFYYVGALGWFRQIQWTFSKNLLGFSFLGAGGIALLALLVFFALRAKARRRLV